MLKIKTCPTCGSRRIRPVVGDYRGNFRGKPYIARRIEHHECPNCGEKLFGPEAMRRIEASRPTQKRKARVA